MKKIILLIAFAVFCSARLKAQQSSFKRLFPNDEKPKAKPSTKSADAPKDVSKPGKQRIFENYSQAKPIAEAGRSAKAGTQRTELVSDKPALKQEQKPATEETKLPPSQGEEKKSN